MSRNKLAATHPHLSYLSIGARDVCCHAQLLHGCWRLKFRFSYLCSMHVIHRALPPGPSCFECGLLGCSHPESSHFQPHVESLSLLHGVSATLAWYRALEYGYAIGTNKTLSCLSYAWDLLSFLFVPYSPFPPHSVIAFVVVVI